MYGSTVILSSPDCRHRGTPHLPIVRAAEDEVTDK